MFSQKPVVGPHLFLQRLFSILLFGLVIVAVLSAPADAAVKRAYAGIVVDAKSGKTLYSRAADSPRYPASVTKVMTLYVLFQELEAGRLKLSSKMRVSKHAAAAVPTKLGLKAGSSIRVEAAIQLLVTLSANDIARVIAEHISGTEEKFAKRMTKTAKALGMSRTTYRNASGLPNSKQITTVRDQARLGIAVHQHFPKYYEYFQIRKYKYGKRTYGNHNKLVGKNGVDGIKTGYIRASGYNLLTAVRKNNRHIIVVGFGYDSGNVRNAKVSSLINTYLPKARKGSYVTQARISKPGLGGIIRYAAVPVTPMPRLANRNTPMPALTPPMPVSVASIDGQSTPAPEPRPLELIPASASEATQLLASNGEPAPIPQPKPVNIVGAWISETLRFEPETNADGIRLPPATIGSSTGNAIGAIDLMTSGAVGNTKSKSWIVQIGAPPSVTAAHGLLSEAVTQIASLSNFRSFIEPAKKNGQIFYRARFAGFGDHNQARTVCNQLKQKNMSCLAMQG